MVESSNFFKSNHEQTNRLVLEISSRTWKGSWISKIKKYFIDFYSEAKRKNVTDSRIF